MTVLLYDQIKDDIFKILESKGDVIETKHLDSLKKIKEKLYKKTYSYKELKELIKHFKTSMDENDTNRTNTEELNYYYKDFLKKKNAKNVSTFSFIGKEIVKILIQFEYLLIISFFIILKFYDFYEDKDKIKYKYIEHTNNIF